MHTYMFIIKFIFVCIAFISNAQSATLIKNATIITLAEGDNSPFNGYLVIEKDKVLAIGKGEYAGAADKIIDASNKIVMPGFVSGHSHLWQSAFRGIASDQPLYPWLKAIHWTYGPYFTKGDFYTFTLHGALDQLLHGITTTYNHTHRLSSDEQQYMEQFTASMDAGQHFIYAYRADLDLPETNIKSTFAKLYAKSQSLKKTSSLLDLSINAVGYYNNPEKFPLELALAKEYGITAQLHYLEQYSRRFHDRKDWALFIDSGAVADNVSYAHFIHPSNAILQQAASKGASMIWNPLSNGRLGSGLADIPNYQAMGLGVGMGVDGAASADIADPFENMRMGLYALRMHHNNPDVMSTIEILRLHTLKTAQVLKVADRVGSLEVGKQADILIINPSNPSTGAVFDPIASLVFACNASNIESVIVAGDIKVEKGKVLHHDMQALEKQLVTRIDQLRQAIETKP
jgi:5-methylthioadenosine/S-adenosylhomocysteine deaminase